VADDRQVSVGGREFTLTHPDKMLFPADGYTKADLVACYRRVADVMVPHLRGRPLMLQRLPDGIGGEAFYQKEVTDYFPEWIRRVEVSKEGGTSVRLSVAAKLGDVAKADESKCGCHEQHYVGGQQQPGGSRVEHGQHTGCAAVGFRADA
jgi:DNA primase